MIAVEVDYTQWRSGEIAAHREGWDTQRHGGGKETCPYHPILNANLYGAWMEGWRHGNDLALAGRGLDAGGVDPQSLNAVPAATPGQNPS